MEVQKSDNTFHNIVVSDNAVLHLGDIIHIHSGREREGAHTLNKIVNRLEHIFGSDDQDRVGADNLDWDPARIHQQLQYVTRTTKVLQEMLAGTVQSQPNNENLIPQASALATLSSRQHSQRSYPNSFRHTQPRLRSTPLWQRQNTTSIVTRKLSIGRLVLRRQRISEASEHPSVLPPVEFWRLTIQFIPKPWFSHKLVKIRLETLLFQQRMFRPSLDPSFADVVPSDHPLIVHAAQGNTHGLRALLSLKDGPGASCTTLSGWTPLHFAAAAGHVEACQLLLQCGANSDATGESSISPLHVAAHFGKLNAFRTLLSAGGDLGDVHEHGMTPLFDLLINESLIDSAELHKFVHWLIKGQNHYLVDTETKDNEGRSVLHYLLKALQSISQYHEDSWIVSTYTANLQALISAGADINARDVYGKTLLHIACADRQYEVVNVLLGCHDCDLDIRDADNYTALHRAIEADDHRLASRLLLGGADPEAVAVPIGSLPPWHDDLRFVIPLSLVAVTGDMRMFDILWSVIKQKYDEDPGTKKHWIEVLGIAARCGNIEIVRHFANLAVLKPLLSRALSTILITKVIEILVDAGASPDGEFDPDSNAQWRPLLWAARCGDLDAATKLLELGADPDCTGHRGMSAIHYAAERGSKAVVELLLSHGANQGARTAFGDSAADLALSSGHTELASALMKELQGTVGVEDSSSHKRPEYSLVSACQRNDVDLARRLVAAGAPLEYFPLGSLWTPLSVAVDWSSFDVVQFLITAGASVHPCFQEHGGRRFQIVPLLEAASKADCRSMKLMIEKGANVNEVLEESSTPLLYVPDRFWCAKTSEARADVVTTLLEAGANLNVNDVSGRTPLGKAQLGSLRATQLLIQAGANLDEISTMNIDEPPTHDDVLALRPRTPIAWAAYFGHKEVVKVLYEAGAQWKGIKKDPAITYIHGFLMKSWFVEPFGLTNSNLHQVTQSRQSNFAPIPGVIKEATGLDASTDVTGTRELLLGQKSGLHSVRDIDFHELFVSSRIKISSSATATYKMLESIVIEVFVIVVFAIFMSISQASTLMFRLIIRS